MQDSTYDVKENIGIVYRNNETNRALVSATTSFAVSNESSIVMTKVVDKPNECYFSGDLIVFTIQIINITDKKMSGLYFIDTIDDSVIPITGTSFDVKSTKGIIEKAQNTVTVNNIELDPGGICIITITGKIK